MPDHEYRVRVTADTKQAGDKLDAVENKLNLIKSGDHTVVLDVDSNGWARARRDTQEIANSIKHVRADVTASATTSLISTGTLQNAAALASQFYSVRKDVKGLGDDIGKSLGKTNVSEFMRTEQFLDRVLDNSRSRTREIVETYKNVRELPGVADVAGPVENFARAKVWENFGDKIAEQTIQGAKAGLNTAVTETKNFLYGDLFNELAEGANRTIDTLARVGLAIQGVQMLVGPLAAAWSAAFDLLIGQNVRLEQTMLSTQTTLASTGRVFNEVTGKEVIDPYQKIQALEGGVKRAIENIRIRSLDLAGVTSQEIIDIFGVVATSISQVGGNLKDAEDLAISFTAALGTLGVPLYQARQEIGSILGGYITEDSLLAKRLQISNRDIEKAKNSVDGVVGYLQKKLETAVSGQAIQAKGFSGVLSNIKEVFEVIGQNIGKPWLKPIVSGLSVIYDFLRSIQSIVVSVGTYLSKIGAETIATIASVFSGSKVGKTISGFVQNLAQPFEEMARNVKLGIQGGTVDLLSAWLNGTAKIPPAMQSIIDSLRTFSNFLKLQVSLILEPLGKLIDQSRTLSDGFAGLVQRTARIGSIPFGNFVEADQTFTMGWDTLTTTIQAAAVAITKFGGALIRLKIEEISTQIRAAATLFEIFGSVVLGRLNLAISFFDFLGTALNNDVVKYFLAVSAISKIVNSTDFFGIKGIATWAVQTRVILAQLIADAKLFVKGFKDAGDISKLMSNAQATYAKALGIQANSKNPVLANLAQIEQANKKLASLHTLQSQMAANGAGAVAMERYGQAIKQTEQALTTLQKTQKSFSATERAGAALKSALGGGAELAQAQEAARQARVMASGAATAQALNAVMGALANKLGLPVEKLKTLTGAAEGATKALKTFLTTSALIEIGFAAATLAISAGIAAWQRYEEAQKRAATTAQNMATINKVLASGYQSIIAAAENGDVAAQKLLDTQRAVAQQQYNSSTEDLTKKQEEYTKLLQRVSRARRDLDRYKENVKETPWAASLFERSGLESSLRYTEQQAAAAKAEIVKLERQRTAALAATIKLQKEEQAGQDYKVLGERRLDLEERLQETRKDFLKEISDKEFIAAQERIDLERQAARERISQEKAALTARFQVLSKNSDDQEKDAIDLLSNYKTGLLDAVEAEAQRKNELEQKQAQMRKAIEDYAYNMAKQRVKLEKEVGGYQKQLEQYKTRMTEIRIQKELQAERAKETFKGIYYKPYNLESQQAFINASQSDQAGGRMDHRDMFLYTQLLSKDQLGITADSDPLVIKAKIRDLLKIVAQRGIEPSVENIARLNDISLDTVQKLRQEAEALFNTSRWSRSQDPTNIAAPNLTIDWAGMQANIEGFNDSIIEARKALNEVLRKGDIQRQSLLLRQAEDPSGITGIRRDYGSELDRSRTQVINTLKRIGKELNPETIRIVEIAKAEQAARARIRGLFADLLEQGKVSNAQVEQLIHYALTNESGSEALKQLFYTLPMEIRQLVNATNKQIHAARIRINQQAPKVAEAEALNQFNSLLEGNFKTPDTKELVQQQFSQIDSLLDALFPEDGFTTLQDRLKRVDLKGRLMIDTLRAAFPLSETMNDELTAAGINFMAAAKRAEQVLEPLRQKIRFASDPLVQLLREWRANGTDIRNMLASQYQTAQSGLADSLYKQLDGSATNEKRASIQADIDKVTQLRDATQAGSAAWLEYNSALERLNGQMNRVGSVAERMATILQDVFKNIYQSFLRMVSEMISKWILLQIMGIMGIGTGGKSNISSVGLEPRTAEGNAAFMDRVFGGSFPIISYTGEGGSFAGGGYTGDGARLGGLDGQGGFMAMLHPRETVIDHTTFAGASLGGAVNSVVNVTISDSGTKVDSNQASQFGRMIEASVMSVINREKRTGGALNRR